MAVLPKYPWVDENGVEHYELIGHYSDENKKIIQTDTGEPYDYAVDTYPTLHSYIESDEDIEEFEVFRGTEQ